MRRDRIALAVAMAVAVGAACMRRPATIIQITPPPPPDTVEVAVWPSILDSARAALSARQFLAADSILATYALEHPDTPEAAEAEFWRALILADPANPDTASRGALPALDSYLARGSDAPYHAPALVIKRLTQIGESLRTVIGAARMTSETRDRIRDEEVQRLRDSLEATKAELERVRRRVTGRIP